MRAALQHVQKCVTTSYTRSGIFGGSGFGPGGALEPDEPGIVDQEWDDVVVVMSVAEAEDLLNLGASQRTQVRSLVKHLRGVLKPAGAIDRSEWTEWPGSEGLLCTVESHRWVRYGPVTVEACEQWAGGQENAGGVGQWLVSVKADHKRLLEELEVLKEAKPSYGPDAPIPVGKLRP